MRGIRTQENAKFNLFFALIQEEAKKHDALFFADAGDGNDFENAEMEGENMMGWLIPHEKAEEFEPVWKASDVDDDWTDFFRWAVWSEEDGKITIHFEE